MDEVSKQSITAEFSEVSLGDKRLDRRLQLIAQAMEKAPEDSFVEQAGDVASLEAMYRFFSNERVCAEPIFEAHAQQTLKRASEHETVLVVHDTTEFRFGGAKERQGMGRLSTSKRDGFLAHYSLCLCPQGEPLGTLGLFAWSRQDKKKRTKAKGSLRDPDRESLRWNDAAEDCARRLSGQSTPIHVMDREGDSFELFACLLERGERFVIRLGHDRRLSKGRGRDFSQPKLNEALDNGTVRFTRKVQLGRREEDRPKKRKVFPERQPRDALLEIRAVSLPLHRAHQHAEHLPDALSLNFVQAKEVDAPPDATPVVWRLVTTEPIDTDEQVAAIIDIYRKRWLIEEFFKAIKTGCRFESHQLEDIKGLLIALVIESTIAWQLLRLRYVARNRADAAATDLLDHQQLAALHKIRIRRGDSQKLLCVQTVIDEIARLGAHLPNNGPPGWLVLKRGLRKLNLLAQGLALARPPDTTKDVINL